ncbi:hypothetical protein RclHR1_11900008 [Rhizophagus clarus]|uniref:Uncharacterized protein n=1 Tax=Rhizophagus clarus TaxID=94130 RepID=A0A2Z6QXG5_9GLOM|nr:hypothetical protein RclHR1_11900008 [Rhizophagus clarus]GES88628.1 hypothetical protein GLOIN_2v1673942 [Rhizophagus clarus]
MSSRTSQNVARRGGGFPNTNSKRANRHNKRNNNNNSDNSSSDGESTTQQKRTRTHSENTMNEDFVTDTAADVGVDGLSSPLKENNTVSTSLSSPPNNTAASSAPNNDTSNSLNASMHARTTTSASPLTHRLIRLLLMIPLLIKYLSHLLLFPLIEMIIKLRPPLIRPPKL